MDDTYRWQVAWPPDSGRDNPTTSIIKLPDGGYLAGPHPYITGAAFWPGSEAITNICQQRAGP